jgi:FG-GAP-like repeat
MGRFWLLIPFAVACSDYKLNSNDDGLGGGGSDGDTASDGGSGGTWGECDPTDFPAVEIGTTDLCFADSPGSFTPIVEWDYGAGSGCLAMPVVGDLDGDGMPEIVVNLSGYFGGTGDLVVLRGDGSGVVWSDENAELGYGSPPAMGDVDGDGSPDLVVVREYASSLLQTGDYTAVLYDAEGNQVWESEHFVGLDFDYATSPSLVDMDNDGSVEVILGRVILNSDGTTRGVGEHGRGSYGITTLGGFSVSESSVSAVTDLDLDGAQEVIVGNARYDVDGNTIWSDSGQDDAMISLANLDDDPEGEIVGITYNTYRAIDTDGTVLWEGRIQSGNILAPAAIADLDLDGYPNIVTAGGNLLVMLNHLGAVMWTATVTDESGATGASIFDFEGDGWPEVVYIDEVQMIVYDGATGARKFYSAEHSSNTMFDYPVIADVDGDDQAEIVVCHNFYDSAVSIYGDLDESWATARQVWNQHAYGISNINDDLSVPQDAVPNFQDSNTWHAAIATDGSVLENDLEAEILEVCTDECAAGTVLVTVRLRNLGVDDLGSPTQMALYAVTGGTRTLLTTATAASTRSGWTSDAVVLEVAAADLAGADEIELAVDDNGSGTGSVAECAETNNSVQWAGPFCE